MTALIHRTKPGRTYYAININMNFSFDSLISLLEKFLGGDIEMGDTLICDNSKGDKRKVIQKTNGGYLIFYGRVEDGKFTPLAEHNGQLKHIKKAVL